jgi:hypothetical protein
MTAREIYVVLGPFVLMGIIQKPTLKPYFTRERVISITGFGDVITFNFGNSETINNFQRPEKLFRMFPVVSDLNKQILVIAFTMLGHFDW